VNVAQELRAILEPDATVLKILCRARGHAFVKLGSAADASAVLSKEYTLGGRRLTVAPTESKQLNLDEEQEPTTAPAIAAEAPTTAPALAAPSPANEIKEPTTAEEPKAEATGEAAEPEEAGEEANAAEEMAADAGSTRNLSIIAHVDHGKTTLSDCLLAAAGQLNEQRSGSACALDTGLEAERGITIYSTSVSLSFPDLTINLTDCPGHAEFNAEVSAALRQTDGALLLVDAAEGCMPQTTAVLRQALAEGCRIVLVLNKMDKLLPDALEGAAGERRPPTDEALRRILAQLDKVVAQVNAIIGAHNAAVAAIRARKKLGAGPPTADAVGDRL